ncbi:MAG: MBOAT family O-acyltransferase [Candidatus Roizmanbacteria bacterium]
MSVAVFLKNYIFIRTLKAGEKPKLKTYILTWLFTAIWHGFYTIYYFTFLWWLCVGEVAREVGRMQASFDLYIPSVV